MICLTEEQRNFIRTNIKNGTDLIRAGTLDEIMDALMDLYAFEGTDKDDEPNAKGYEIEKMMDSIFQDNQ